MVLSLFGNTFYSMVFGLPGYFWCVFFVVMYRWWSISPLVFGLWSFRSLKTPSKNGRSFRRCRSHRMLESSCNLFEYTKNGFPNTGDNKSKKKRGDEVTNLGKRTLFGESFRVPSRPSERMGFSPSRRLFSLRSGIYKSTIPCGY